MAKWLLNQPQPIIVIDWSDLQVHRKKFLLRAAVPVKGQTMTVLEAVYEQHEKQKPQIEREFLRRLRSLRKLGWDYVGRVPRRTYTRWGKDNPMRRADALFAHASATSEHRGDGQLRRLRARSGSDQ